MKSLEKQNSICAVIEDICVICSIGDDLENYEHCEFDVVRKNNNCPAFKCSEQCRNCKSDCEFLGK